MNGLNQYQAAGPASFSYDANGNLTSDGTTSYGYDVENRLVTTSAGANLVYDPYGRLFQISRSGQTTQFVYDGDQLAVEYDGAGNMQRRFMFAGMDEPILEDTGSALNCSGTRVLHTNHQGSIIAQADCWGNRTNVNAYDEYGIPQAGNVGRFQYTGQAWLPEIGMYYYKARIYSPTLGRFLQTDPLGYEDQINLYAYVANDPVNGRDPSGMKNCPINDPNCIETPASAANPSQPDKNPPETDKKDEIVVTAQKKKRNSSGIKEQFFVVTIASFTRQRLRQRDIPCPGGLPTTVGVADPIPSGASAAHSHPSSHSTVPGRGDNNFGKTSNTAYVITPSRAYAIDRSSNGTYRTRVLSGGALSASERAELVDNMQNWESGNSSDRSKTLQQRFCKP